MKKGLARRLANIQTQLGQADAQALQGYQEGSAKLLKDASSNEAAAADSSAQALVNRGRERVNAMSQAALQGAGESDLLRTQEMSLRNWNANQSEVTRSYFDTKNSITGSLSELENNTRTARFNASRTASESRDSVYSEYYNARSETLTNLGNLYGQQAEYYGLANEQVGSKKSRARQKQAAARSRRAAMAASKTSGEGYTDPGVPSSITQWKGDAKVEDAMTNEFRGSPAGSGNKPAPSGATLRKW